MRAACTLSSHPDHFPLGDAGYPRTSAFTRPSSRTLFFLPTRSFVPACLCNGDPPRSSGHRERVPSGSRSAVVWALQHPLWHRAMRPWGAAHACRWRYAPCLGLVRGGAVSLVRSHHCWGLPLLADLVAVLYVHSLVPSGGAGGDARGILCAACHCGERTAQRGYAECMELCIRLWDIHQGAERRRNCWFVRSLSAQL